MSDVDLLQFAVEDRFIILKLWEPSALLPGGDLARTVARVFASFSPKYTLVLDSQEIETFTSDVEEFLSALNDLNVTLVAREANAKWLRSELRQHSLRGFKVWPLRQDLPTFDMTVFPMPAVHNYSMDHEAWRRWRRASEAIDQTSPPTPLEWKLMQKIQADLDLPYSDEYTYPEFMKDWSARLEDGEIYGRIVPWYYAWGKEDAVLSRRWLEQTITAIARNSLLTQFAIELAGDDVIITPYHGRAVYSVETRSEIILGRPSVYAKNVASLVSHDLEELADLIASRSSELKIQRFLQEHPDVLYSLGYLKIYPQVVLQREDGSYLRPDFLLQPIGDEWCDVLDLKIPDRTIIVGSKDRKTLAASIHELVAQLREYGAYFEDPRQAKRIEDRYGIKCYRPRLIGVVGRDVSCYDERQLRRAMTAYADVDLLTFDRLLAVARQRMLL